MGCFICIHKIAANLLFFDFGTFKRKRNNLFVALLNLHFVKIEGFGVYSCRCSRFKAPELHAEVFKAFAQLICRKHSVRPALTRITADKNFSAQICSRSDNYRLYLIFASGMRNNSAHFSVANLYINYFRLLDLQIFRFFKTFFHFEMITSAVNLRTQRMYRRAFAAVKHFRLNKRRIGSLSHFAAESVNLADKMPLCRSAYTRIARKISDCVKTY